MLKNLPQYVAYVRKAIIQVLGLVTALLALGYLPDKYNQWGAIAVGVLTTVLHFLTPNGAAPGTSPALENFDPADDDEDVDEPISEDFLPAETITAGQVAAKNEQAAPPNQ